MSAPSTPRRVSRSWWHRQRMPLLALALTLVAVLGIHFWLDVRPTLPDAAAPTIAGDVAEIAGQELALTGARWSEFEAPEGSRTLSIRFSANGGPDAAACGLFRLTEPRTGRVWNNARSLLDVPWDEGESGCVEESAAYTILAVYLLPDDAVGPFHLDLDAAPPGDDVPGQVRPVTRFLIEP